MKESGMYRRVDVLGRITLPMEMRRALEIGEGDLVGIAIEGDRIVLRKVQHSCVFCGDAEKLIPLREKYICRNCLDALKQ